MRWWTLRQLESSDASKRAAAGKSLGNSGSLQVFAHLVSALADTEFDVRRAAVEALGAIANPQRG
jgi:HEAT repeat protein